MTDTATASVPEAQRPADAGALLSVRDLRTYFHTDAGVVKAVDGVSFDVERGEVLAVVGESGSGKSVTGLTIMGLLPQATAKVETGEILWKGRDLLKLKPAEMRKLRGEEITMIFQDPMTALNPVFSTGAQIVEMIRLHERVSKKVALARAADMLAAVGIPQPRKRLDMYPHEFSGGMRQRAMIAMAIACDPDLILADEPTTALDVTVQAQVLEVLSEIRERTGAAIVLITHDLGVVAGVADRIMVMYAGRQVETGTTDETFYETRHPYTLGLLASLPRADQESGSLRLKPIVGQPPSLVNRPPGCAFHPRCDFAELPSPCSTEDPALRPIGSGTHRVACHFAEKLQAVDVEDLKRRATEVDVDQADVVLGRASDVPEFADVGGLEPGADPTKPAPDRPPPGPVAVPDPDDPTPPHDPVDPQDRNAPQDPFDPHDRIGPRDPFGPRDLADPEGEPS